MTIGAHGAPAVVAIGGGHGLAATLRAVREYAGSTTAIVSVADDGGSTGRLRSSGPRPAPGDLRKCLIALAGRPSALSRAMEHRFADGELAGHAFGNLLLVALADSEGDLVTALDETAELLGCVGRVLPATSDVVTLRASCGSGRSMSGQVAISECGDVSTVSLDPPDATPCPAALEAVAAADQIVLGPGSLFTSVLAATAVRGLTEAIASADAQVVYVCNLRPQANETAGYDVADHVTALVRHGIEPDLVLYDPDVIGGAEEVPNAVPVRVARPSGLAHDPELLAKVLESQLER